MKKNLLIVMAVAIASLAFIPGNALSQVGDNYFLTVEDENGDPVMDLVNVTSGSTCGRNSPTNSICGGI